jgi:hypothetical protein
MCCSCSKRETRDWPGEASRCWKRGQARQGKSPRSRACGELEKADSVVNLNRLALSEWRRQSTTRQASERGNCDRRLIDSLSVGSNQINYILA